MSEIDALNKDWARVSKWFEEQFGMESDPESMLFMIGMQELGKGAIEFNKQEKMELMHIGVCSVLMPGGYYEVSHIDEEGWPHFNNIKKLPPLKGQQQQEFMKQALVDYFIQYL